MRVEGSMDSELLQTYLDKLANWCKENLLSPNREKSYQISFTRKCVVTNHKYKISSHPLEAQFKVTDLGVI